MEDLEGHLWTPSFLKFISQSNDEKRLRALQQIILHSQGEKQKTDGNFTQIDNVQKSKPPRKAINGKIILPKNSSKNMDALKIDDSLDLLDTSGDSPKSNQNVPKEVPKKISPRIRKPKKFDETNSPNMYNKYLLPPIMGKWALLTKYNNILRNSNNDGEIVTKIVMEKFKNILSNYHRRSFMRKPTNEDIFEDANIDRTIINTPLVTDDNISNSKTDSSESTKDDHFDIIYQNMDPLWEERFLGQENDSSEKAKKEVLERPISTHDQPLGPHLAEVTTAAKISNQPKNVNLCDSEKLNEEALFEEKVQYDAQKFLEVALGDELCNLSSEEFTNDECETTLPFSSNDNECSSINTTQISSLYQASTYLSNIVPGRIPQSNDADPSTPISYEEVFTDFPSPSNSKASILILKAAAQDQIILQTCKALNFCESSKQFKSSPEYIEAEKILLLATLKYEAVKNELRDVDYEELKDLGQVTISNLAFPAAAEIPLSDEFSQWCFAVACCGSTVLATETVRAQNGDIRFERSFHFENLDVDFDILISIYTLYVQNYSKKGGQDSKFHIKQETATCPTPSKLINFHKSPKHSKPTYSYERRRSSFLLCGTTIIRLADLTKPEPFKLSRVPNSSTLKGIMTADVSSSIELTGTYSGFLTIGSEAGGYATWNRRWCHLNGYQLQYWNYPAEEELEPIGTIDLRFCVASRINQVDRELCARPRTLLLETGRLSSPRDQNSLMVLCNSSYTITKHYLSADNHQAMAKWQNRLNSVISMLRNWNCMKCQLYFPR